ncbi:uncharacterized protein LOC143560040 [Bidens hawaiensis]|uniref:uncharacterized protein LOC143560040 n=1 Tax=Bidens hawaiensis TaxID=980011 RepID=UPI00404B6024
MCIPNPIWLQIADLCGRLTDPSLQYCRNSMNMEFLAMNVAHHLSISFPKPEILNISLIGCIAKVISNVFADRLKVVIRSLVSKSQMAYISGRSILDGPLILNELHYWLKNSKDPAFFFKIDLNKAFTDRVLEAMNLPALWRLWVNGILRLSKA